MKVWYKCKQCGKKGKHSEGWATIRCSNCGGAMKRMPDEEQ